MEWENIKIDIKHPHDTFFKKIFGDVRNTRDFLKSYLPSDLSSKIDFEKIQITDTEKMDAKYKDFFLDLSVNCEIEGIQSKIYIVFEHKSYKDRLTLIQILNYCLLIWSDEINEKKEHLTPIIPFIFYQGELKSGFHKNFSDYFKVDEWLKKYLLNFKMVIFDTTLVTEDEIKRSINNLFLTSAILLMKNIFKNPDDLKPVFKHIIELDDERKIILFEYITTKRDITEKKFNDIMTELKGDEMPSLAQVWMDRGKEKWLQEGRLEGRLEGELRGELKRLYKTIKRGLELKFNQINDRLFISITKIKEIKKLEEIQEAIFTINDINEFKIFVKKLNNRKSRNI